MTKQQKRERQEAIEKLRAMLKPGDTVRTILRHVSRSGMRRCVSPIIDGEDRSYLVALALGAKVDQKHGGIKVDGCGMDMGFHLVYGLSATLWPDGFGCVGEGGENRSARCPSNDHSNGDCDYTPHTHKNGGYALRQRWL